MGGTQKRFKWLVRVVAVSVSSAALALTSACAESGWRTGKVYDISPIVTLSESRCLQYDGDIKGEGLNQTCMVNKDNCIRAVTETQGATEELENLIQPLCS